MTLAVYFNLTAVFLDAFRTVAFGLVGGGSYALPLLFLVSGGVLLFHRGQPVRLRLFCVFAWGPAWAAFMQMPLQSEAAAPFPGLAALWTAGVTGRGGGVLGGSVCWALVRTISRPGAAILLALLMVSAVFTVFRISPAAVIDFIRKPRAPYAPVSSAPRAEPSSSSGKRTEKPRRDRRRAGPIDIPLDPVPTDPGSGGSSCPDREGGSPSGGLLPPKPADLKTPAEALREDSREGSLQPASTPVGPSAALEESDDPPFEILPPPKPAKKSSEPPAAAPASMPAESPGSPIAAEAGAQDPPPYLPPALSLLAAPSAAGAVDSADELRASRDRLMETIASFGIESKIHGVTHGPAVARFELELEKGMKLSRLVGLSDDIALALGVSGVRIAPVEGRAAVVGIEVPNRLKSTVYLRDVLESPTFTQSKSRISFAVGRDIAGESVVGDIARLTHLLIAGTTGSGKSVCVNSLIISLLYGASPDQVKLILIDPKMVELIPYSGVPHLRIPVVTDPKKAAGALQEMVAEMEKRYRLFMERGVKDLSAYNESASAKGDIQPLPQIVIIVDELADLMMSAAKEVEDSIVRIAQKARAAGMHLIIATQRPSADVITGLMKANIPSRIAFTVASQLESRIILDTMGAEKLVGRGDMLYRPIGAMKPQRVQGCLITEREVEAVVAAVRQNVSQPEYDEELMEKIERAAETTGVKGGPSKAAAAPSPEENADDALLPSAVEIVLETGQASASMLQRRLKLGYARASRLVDEMEKKGIVGPFEGSKPRQILISRQDWDARSGA